ncbi:hypothetical protein Dimus_014687 [Dionaea muscipula]
MDDELIKLKQSLAELNSNPDENVDALFLGSSSVAMFSHPSSSSSRTTTTTPAADHPISNYIHDHHLQYLVGAGAQNTRCFLSPYDHDDQYFTGAPYFPAPTTAGFDIGTSSSMSDCPQFSSPLITCANKITNQGIGGGSKRKKKKNDGEMEKPREVIHVRAKRGQATDSHSLAERVRREKINEKLRVLQDLVPGCYKTMGMAVMLDVIINYVRSLQNQIEASSLQLIWFLSMKLSAASLFYDFNSPEAEAVETFQRTNPSETHEIERMLREGYEGVPHRSPWPF